MSNNYSGLCEGVNSVDATLGWISINHSCMTRSGIAITTS